jgi:hypothetical protein
MDSHSPKVYRDLLTEFRNGYAKHGRSVFSLQALSRDEEQATPKEAMRSCLEWFGAISFSSVRWRVWGVAGGPIDCPNPDVYQQVLERTREAMECFEPLAARAGAHLPAAVRKAFVADPPDAQSWWASLLWWAQAPGEEDFNFCINSRRIVTDSPFEDSVRVIEALGLATDTPEMPFRVYLEGAPLDPAIVYESEGDNKDDRVVPPEAGNGDGDTEATPLPQTPAPPSGKTGKRRGRKKVYDPKADRRLADAWATGQYKRYADLAAEKGMSAKAVELALGRHRKRQRQQ